MDFIVTRYVPIQVRVENVDDAAAADGIADDYAREDAVLDKIEAAIDNSRFYLDRDAFGAGSGSFVEPDPAP